MIRKKLLMGIGCLFMTVMFMLGVGLLSKPTQTAYAITVGTSTSGKWSTGQTGNLIPTISASTSWSTLTGQGWGKGSKTSAVEVYETESHGVGIRPSSEGHLGHEDYTGGIYYVIELSAADKVKAKLGQLYVTGSAQFYLQGATTCHLSIRAEFLDSSTTTIDTAKKTYTDYRAALTQSSTSLSLSNSKVPQNTAYIRIWYSNHKNLDARPWIAKMVCKLVDTTAPSFVSGYLEKTSVVDSTNNVVIAGNTIKYGLKFNEKISIVSNGTASISLDGGSYMSSTSSTAVNNSDGTTSVVYSFTLRDSNKSGQIALSSVSGLSFKDEAGNQSTYSGIPSVGTLQYYKTMSVTKTVSKLSATADATAIYNTNYTATLNANMGYKLPSTISVSIGGSIVSASSSTYTYNSSTGAITIYGKAITGDIVITANGVAISSIVSLDMTGGSGGTESTTATYDSAMPKITPPNKTGYTFKGYYTQANGGGTQYYTSNGESAKAFDKTTATTLYASWQNNKYTVTYNTNKPSNASNSVLGATENSSHTYDLASALTTNGYSLKGWSFKGWAIIPSGEVVYTDGAQVSTLVVTDNGEYTLYAVWEANKYTVEYLSNKPSGASSSIEGTMSKSTFSYDTEANLSNVGYALKGYTFKGWATSSSGNKVYDNGQEILNITHNANANIKLYAVWQANTYYVKYDINQPQSSSAVSGGMSNSTHVYDTASNLTTVNYTLLGWTFKGWAINPNGSVVYNDKAQIKTLVENEGGTYTLYAVWEANKYSIIYNSNKPVNASTNIEGGMENSNHVYDLEKNLSVNGYTLKGYTFKGWAKTAEGSVAYDNKGVVINLASEVNGSATVYAVWQANTYEITLSTLGDGAGVYTATFDKQLPAVAVSMRNGYNFVGYYTMPNGQGEKYYNNEGKANNSLTYTLTNDITVYAEWSPITYFIDLYSQGRFIKKIEVIYGTLSLPSATELSLERDNYDFVGWNMYDEQNWSMYLADKVYNVGIANEQDQLVTVYAAWQEKPIHTLNFDANGGFGAPAMKQVHEEEVIVLDNIIPVRENYTFIGWAVNQDANKAQFLPDGEFKMGTELVTLYAVWVHNPQLTYSANGGEFITAIATQHPAHNQTVKVSTIKPIKVGYTFIGWALNDSAQVAEYTGSSDFIMPKSDTVLYAVWQKTSYVISKEVASGYQINGLQNSYYYGDSVQFSVSGIEPNVYVNGQMINSIEQQYSFVINGQTTILVTDGSALSVIYSANGGVGAPVDSNAYSSYDSAVISSTVPTRTGYKFIGWSDVAQGQTPDYVGGDSIALGSEDVVLYAVWQANSYTVNYSSNGGVGQMTANEFDYDVACKLSSNTLSKEGCTFVGWATGPSGLAVYADQADVINLSDNDGGTVTLYAVWEQTVSYVTFDNQKATMSGSANVVVAYGELIPQGLIAPIRIGYNFGGYYTLENGGGIKVLDDNMNACDSFAIGWNINQTNVILYAYWTPINYTVIYIANGKTLGQTFATYDSNFNLTTSTELGVIPQQNTYFAGWATLGGSNNVAYDDGQQILDGLTQTSGAEVYLYGVFKELPKAYVSYDANGGNNVPVDNTAYYVGSEFTIKSVIPQREGYLFKGWNYDPNDIFIAFPYSDGVFTIDKAIMLENGITLYAVWKEGETLKAQITQAKQSITNVQSDLTTAVSSLESAIANGDDDLDTKISNLKTAYTAADDLINSDITALKGVDVEIKASITKLESNLTLAQTQLTASINLVQSNLDAAVKSLTNAINSGDENLEQKIADLDTNYKNADTLIKSDILALQNADNDIKTSITKLEGALQLAESKLTTAINTVQGNLDTTIKSLTNAISSGDANLEQKIADLDATYKNADTLIKSDILALQNADNDIKTSITKLENNLTSAQKQLTASINLVQNNLDTAVKNLTSAINSGDANLEQKIAELDNAYKNADMLINADILALQNTDTEIEASIIELQGNLQTAQTQLTTAINAVQGNLDAAVTNLTNAINSGDTELKDKIANLDVAYKNADSLINTHIIALHDKDVQTAQEIADLKALLQQADSQLQTSINTVQTNLDSAVARLNTLMANGKTALSEQIVLVEQAYLAADVVINGNILALQNKDKETTDSIKTLGDSLKTADEKLQNAINVVKSELDKAVSQLQTAIDNGDDNLDEKISALKNAYEQADVATNLEIDSIKEKIDNMETSYKQADRLLEIAIEEIQKDINNTSSNIKKLEEKESLYIGLIAGTGALSLSGIGLGMYLLIKKLKRR